MQLSAVPASGAKALRFSLRRAVQVAVFAGFGLAAVAGPAWSVPAAVHPEAAASGLKLPARVETRHTITLGQQRLQFRAVAENFPLTNSKGVETASVFTVSYIAQGAPGGNRPVSFVFDGGPGAASVFLQLGALGPRVLATPDNGEAPSPPIRLVDNPSSWIKFTDLVFIDPVGTGFSRAVGKGPDPAKPFFNVRGDIQSLDEVIRLWLTRHRRWDSPVYLVGESYGGFRVAAMAESLARDVGVVPTGLIMVSPALDLSLLHTRLPDLLAPALELPSYAACVAVLDGNRGAPDSEAAVEQFALSDYLVGLARLDGVPPPGDPLMARIAHITGIAPQIVSRYRGRVPIDVFARNVRAGAGERVSLYDGTVARPAPGRKSGGGDPVLGPAVAAFTAAFDIYAPSYLNYHTERAYRTLPRNISQQWNWQAAREGGDGLGLALSSLQKFLLQHPQTKVLIANGRYDLVTPFFASRWLVDQLAIPARIRRGIELHVFDGGHMMYMRPNVRAALARVAEKLYGSNGAAL